VDEVFICNVDDLEVPLGFEFAAESFGLNVSHEIAPDVAAQKMNQTKTSMNQTATSLNSSFSDIQNKTGVSSPVMGMFGMNLINKLQRELEGRQLKALSFPNCKINKPIS
jgi:hypothetical protein